MRKTAGMAIALLLLVLAAGCSRSNATVNGVATDEGIAAIALPEEQYRDMLKRSALGTQSGAISLGVLGLDEGCDVLDGAVERVVEKNLPLWRTNLIAAYREQVPADQLARAVKRSPRQARSILQQHLSSIGRAMQHSSEPLLQTSSAEVLESLSSVAAKVNRATIDMATRERDLARMKTSRQICGVG